MTLYQITYLRDRERRSLSFSAADLVDALAIAGRLARSWGLKDWGLRNSPPGHWRSK